MLIKLFHEQVRKRPDKIAVKAGECALTYGFLDACTDGLARVLSQSGAHPVRDRTVALLMGHDRGMIIAIIGVLKAGLVYMPFDPTYPEERLTYMLKDSNCQLIVSSAENIELAIKLTDNIRKPLAIINLDKIDPGAALESSYVERGPAQTAYILYTSGSTGRPKGVVQNHQNISYYVGNWSRRFSVCAADRMVQFASFSHDGAVPDIYSALLNGATLYLFDIRQKANIEWPAQWLNKERITIWHSVPTWYRYFVNTLTGAEEFPYLRLIVLGGEAVREHDIMMFKKYFPRARFGNIYGQTESTVSSIWLVSPGDDFKKVLIGEPADETGIFVIGSTGSEVGEYEVGEIVMAGHNLSPGYLNNGEATHGVFSRDEEFGSLYWSGDLGRRLPDGGIEILGRKDHQVKVRGFRIEPGEIETVLLQHPGISQAVVTAKESAAGSIYGTVSGDSNLWAYVVSSTDFTIHDLREYLAAELPDYMIPAYFVKLDTMPLTPSGKIDRKSLDARGMRLGTGTPYAPPGSETETALALLWKEVLKLDKIGIDDNFFELGGSSMDVIALNNGLQKIFKQSIPAVAIFQYLTVRSFAQYLHGWVSPGGKINKGLERGIERGLERGIGGIREKADIEAKPRAGETGEEVAVIGMAGRFPGAKDIEEFWENLKNGMEAISFFSDEELAESGVARELLQNSSYVKAQVSLEGVEYFDAFFFGYNPREAEIMDPQMRIFHECVYHALEDAGYDPYTYENSIGLYAGASVNYAWLAKSLLAGQGDAAGLFAARQLFDKEYMCTRVAYKLNLRGTAVSVQTACSTSLVAIHLACRELWGGECHLALAGGVSIAVTAKQGFIYRQGMIFSADGHCRAFDAKADGTIFGDGAGVVVLKRLPEARRDRDNIYAVIKGSFTNNDGLNRGGYTAPSAAGEAEVIRTALQMARVKPESIGYVETHGTATALGDPIEIEGLKLAFNTDKKGFCAIGSVKSNIGHLNMAAGVTGFIKTVLALKHGLIPPGLHFETPNPAIDFENSPFYVNTCLTPWKNDRYPRRAGVSSFGIGGTNAHVILEEFIAETGGLAPLPDTPPSRDYRLILLSARTGTALDRMTRNLADFLKKNKDVPLADIAYTLMKGREVFEHRKMLVCRHTDEAIEKLTPGQPGRVHSFSGKAQRKPVIFMFPGLGAQYVDMGRGLYETVPVFRQEMDRCFEILKPLLDIDFKEILYPTVDEYRSNRFNRSTRSCFSLDQVENAQVAIFIFEYALAKLSMAWGIQPLGMMGYSFGEYAAACISGVFTPADALKMIVTRGKLLNKLEPGAMLSVPLPVDRLQPFLDNHPQLSLAIDNGPSCIIAGATAAAAVFEKEMKQNRILCLPIATARALHSTMMTPILKEFAGTVAKEVTLNRPQIPYISNVTGDWAVPADVSEPAYWAGHLAGTVRFAAGVRKLMKIDNALFLEIGPGRDLSTLLVRHIEGKPGLKATNLVRHRDQDIGDVYFLLNKLGRLWLWGAAVDWEQLFRHEKRYRVSLPKYPFERTPFSSRNPDEKAAAIFSRQSLVEKSFPAGAVKADTLKETAGRPDMETEYAGPRDKIEQTMTRTWVEFFGFEPIGIDDDFFDLGGDSLKALVVLSKMNQALAIELTPDEFFRNPTVRSLASAAANRLNPGGDRKEPPMLDLLDTAAATVKKLRASGTDPAEVEADLIKYIQQPLMLLNRPDRNKLFCFPPVLGFGAAYKSLAGELVDYSLYAFNFLEDPERLSRYMQLITGIQPDGPYVLLGYSAGGKITFEMAKAMENHHLEVADVILLDYFWTAQRVEGDPAGAVAGIAKELDAAGVGFLKDTIANKIKKYREYYAAPAAVEVVNANVHLVLSRENQNTPHARCWDELTAKTSKIYQGYGEHIGMLNPGAAAGNAGIIRKIMESCQFSNYPEMYEKEEG